MKISEAHLLEEGIPPSESLYRLGPRYFEICYAVNFEE
jgi:hypothetical protein